MDRFSVTFIQEMLWGMIGARGLVWSMLDALGAFDPGSNPGRPTKFHEGEVHRQNAVAIYADGGGR